MPDEVKAQDPNQPPKPPVDVPKEQLPKTNIATPVNKPPAPSGGTAGTQAKAPVPNTVVNHPSSPSGSLAPGKPPQVPPANEDPASKPPNPDPAPSVAVGASPATQTNSVTSMVPPHGTSDYFGHGAIDFNDANKVKEALEKYTSVEPLSAGSQYTHKGVCKKCGWQSHQFSQADAHDAVLTHAQKHLREVR